MSLFDTNKEKLDDILAQLEKDIKAGKIKNQADLNCENLFQLEFKSQSVSNKRECLILSLIPVNVNYWGAFGVSSVITSKGDFSMPLKIVLIVKQYLETSQSYIQWRSRFWEIVDDTILINLTCEIAETEGALLAGKFAHETMLKYVVEMNKTSENLSSEEISNLEAFKDVGLQKGFNREDIIGTGALREFVPSYMKNNIFERPKKSPRSFDQNVNSLNDEIRRELNDPDLEKLLEDQGFVQFFFNLFKKKE